MSVYDLMKLACSRGASGLCRYGNVECHADDGKAQACPVLDKHNDGSLYGVYKINPTGVSANRWRILDAKINFESNLLEF